MDCEINGNLSDFLDNLSGNLSPRHGNHTLFADEKALFIVVLSPGMSAKRAQNFCQRGLIITRLTSNYHAFCHFPPNASRFIRVHDTNGRHFMGNVAIEWSGFDPSES
jgi:hypothetical protein